MIVVSDGHDEETIAIMDRGEWKVPVKFFEIEKSQQGKARNTGMKEAQARRTLFIGDDILLAPDACEAHINAHKRQAEEDGPLSIAVLGHISWHPEIETNQVMDWLDKSGWQFGYCRLTRHSKKLIPHRHQHRFTYTSHISIPTDLARMHPFSEDVTLYGWEDMEWGERLKKTPVRLLYEPSARAYHYHPVTLEDSLKRMETLGRSVKHYPGIDRTPRGFKRLAYEILALFPTLGGKHRKAFLKGLRKE